MEKSPQLEMIMDLTHNLVTDQQDVRDALFETASKILELRGEPAIQEHDNLLLLLSVRVSDVFFSGIRDYTRYLKAIWSVQLIRKAQPLKPQNLFLLPGAWSVLAAGTDLDPYDQLTDNILLADPKIKAPISNTLTGIQSIKDAPAIDVSKSKILFKEIINKVVVDAPTWSKFKTAVDKYLGWLIVVEATKPPSWEEAVKIQDRVPKFSVEGFSGNGYKRVLELLNESDFAAALEKLQKNEKSQSSGFVIFVSPKKENDSKLHLLYWPNKPDGVTVSKWPGMQGPVEVKLEDAAKWVKYFVSAREVPKKLDAILKGFNE
jgi:hypothetical protein